MRGRGLVGLILCLEKCHIFHLFDFCNNSKLICNFIEIAFRHGSSSVDLLHIFRKLLNTCGDFYTLKPSDGISVEEELQVMVSNRTIII